MIDIVVRAALVLAYASLFVCAVRVFRHNHMLAARKVSTAAIAGIAFFWAALWLDFLLVIPSDWTVNNPILLQAWFSRIIHIPQIAMLTLQLYMIRKAEDI